MPVSRMRSVVVAAVVVVVCCCLLLFVVVCCCLLLFVVVLLLPLLRTTKSSKRNSNSVFIVSAKSVTKLYIMQSTGTCAKLPVHLARSVFLLTTAAITVQTTTTSTLRE